MTNDAARAVRVEAPGRLAVVPVEVAPPGPGDVLVRVAWAGICGSDRDLLAGTRPAAYVRYPVIPGHEWSGSVAAVGPGVDGGLVGCPVVAEGFRSCQRCGACRRGETTLCEADYEETGFTLPGAWADFVTVPTRLVHLLPEGADLRAAALLEPAACVAEACLRAAVVPGERAAVVGAGTLGLLATQLLRAAGAAEILVVDPDDRRESVALRCGATSYTTSAAAVLGDADVVIEAAGAPGSAQRAADLVRRGGRVVLTGIPTDAAVAIRTQSLVTRQVALQTVFGAPTRAWVHVVRAFAAGLLDPAPLVTHERSLDDVTGALAVLGDPGSGAIKVLLHP